MKLIVFLMAFLLSMSCAIAEDVVKSSLKINRYKCNLWNIPQDLSQGYIGPIVLAQNCTLVINNNGLLYYTWKNTELDLSGNHKTIDRMSATCSECCDEIYLAIDNILYEISRKEVVWKKEFHSSVQGNPIVFNDMLAVLTTDNHLHILERKNGSTIWFYHNDNNQAAKLYQISPVTTKNKVIAPFQNGELIAFDKEGEKIWSYKLLFRNLLETNSRDITISPIIKGDMLIVTNKSNVVAIDIKSGSLLWSEPIQVKNISDGMRVMRGLNPPRIKDISSEEFFIINKENKVMKVAVINGQIIWSTNLEVSNSISDNLKDAHYAKPVIENGELLIISNKGIMFILEEKSGIIKEIVSISEGVYHPPATSGIVDWYYIFTTERKGVYECDRRLSSKVEETEKKQY